MLRHLRPTTILILAVCALFAACGHGKDGEGSPTLEAVERCDRLYARGDLDMVLTQLRSILEQDSKSFLARYRLGVLELDGNPRQALTDLEQAASLRPAHPGPRFYSGIARIRLSDFDGGDREMEVALNLAAARLGYSLPETSDVVREGLTALQNGQLRVADERFTTATKNQPRNAVLWYLLGRVLMDGGDPVHAGEAVNRALDLDSDLAPALVLRAEWHLSRKENDAAKSDLDKALLRAPDLAAAHLQMGRLLQAESEYRGAILEYWAAVLADPTVPEAHRALGNSMFGANMSYGAVHMQNLEWLNAFLARRRGSTLFSVPR